MKLKFDSNLPYQQEAIASVVDLFEGLVGRAHFKALGVDFKDAVSIHDVLQA